MILHNYSYYDYTEQNSQPQEKETFLKSIIISLNK